MNILVVTLNRYLEVMSDLSKYSIYSEPVASPTSIDNADELSLKDQEIRRFAQDTTHRKVLVCWMMWVVSLWLGAVLLITIFNGLLNLQIDNNVLITLLATTTINVLGLSRIVLNGLFGSRNRKRK